MKIYKNRLNLQKFLKNFFNLNVMDTIPLIKYPSYLPIPSNFKFQEYSTYIRNKNTITKIRRYRLIGIE